MLNTNLILNMTYFVPVRTCIPTNVIYRSHYVFNDLRRERALSLYWYWWNCWVSLFKLFFYSVGGGVMDMVFNATFNNILVISWRWVLLVEETGEPGENHWPVASHWQTLSYNVVSSTPRLSGVRTHNLIDDRHWLHR